MRPDMHKVVVERPRYGRGWATSKAPLKPPFDESPRYESMKANHTRRKWFSDLLGPLRRWLHAQLGRPWNDVYSEACAVIKPDSVVRAHIKTHLLEFVQRHTFMKNNQVWCFAGRWGVQEMPVAVAASHGSLFYVDPLTRLLCAAPLLPRQRWRDKSAECRALTQRW